MAKFVVQPHVRLQEWVAEEKGYFSAEGLDYEFSAEGFAGGSKTTTAAVKPADQAGVDLRSGAFEDMRQGRACDISAACHWAVNAAATTTSGKMWADAYSVSPAGIFVAANSAHREPADLADVPVAVGYHSGSHYSAIQGLAPYLDRSEIKLSFAGLPYDRVRLLIRGEIPAANVFGAQFYLLEQLGFRKLIDTTFMMGFYIADGVDTEDVRRYFRALRAAQRDIDIEPERYKKHWLREMPADLGEQVDVRRFGPGERIVFETYTRQMFESTQRWMKEWNLLDAAAEVAAQYHEAVLT